MQSSAFIIKNLTESITLSPLAQDNRFTKIGASDLGRMRESWIAVDQGKIEKKN